MKNSTAFVAAGLFSLFAVPFQDKLRTVIRRAGRRILLDKGTLQ
jgi:hypothetical protein